MLLNDFIGVSSPLILKGVSATLQSGRSTLSYLRRRYIWLLTAIVLSLFVANRVGVGLHSGLLICIWIQMTSFSFQCFEWWCPLEIKWNESGFRPPLCTYRLNWARRTSWGWWDDWDDTVLQTQDSKFEPWRSEAEHATSRSRRLPTILTFTRGWGRNTFCFFQTAETGNRAPNSGVKGSGANHYPRAPARCPLDTRRRLYQH